ncbi:3-dehydroquinate synthase [Saltatorellus ferox]|uniref:3-dehydroquinate synthase n=1 Tax=Saltatorellus ferox TaxID=2528018 RepID=UPI003AF3F6CB
MPNAPYDVHVGEGVLQGIAAATAGADRVAVVSDREVCALHGDLRRHGVDAPMLEFDGGESIKTLGVLEEVLDFCAASSLSRSSILVAYGGGTVGDLTGMAASLFKRGLRVIQVPTTLLAQVDASVGGKTAINLAAGKNLAGTFHQPHAVFCDTGLLGTLSEAEYQSGLGEVIKTALIEGEPALAQLESISRDLGARAVTALSDTVARCVTTKARVVVSDPEERGARRSLNLGHTFAHAIEHAAGYGRVPHGIAVAVGLQLAASASERVYASSTDLGERIGRLLSAFGLPADLEELRSRYSLGAALTANALIEGLGHDKKGRVGAPEFVLMRGPGDIELGVMIAEEELRDLLA